MENCRRRQSSSTSVLLPTGSSGNGMTVQQELVPGRESCGRDIRITFTIQDTSLGPLKRGLGDDDFFNCSTKRKAEVFLRTEPRASASGHSLMKFGFARNFWRAGERARCTFYTIKVMTRRDLAKLAAGAAMAPQRRLRGAVKD